VFARSPHNLPFLPPAIDTILDGIGGSSCSAHTPGPVGHPCEHVAQTVADEVEGERMGISLRSVWSLANGGTGRAAW